MPTASAPSVLRQMLRPAPNAVSGAAVTDARAWRMSLPRASEQAAGLVAAVSGLEMTETDLDGVLANWDMFALSMGLAGPAAARGLVLADAELRAGLIEVQTLGRVLRQAAELRPATAVDAAMVGHVVDAWIAGFEAAVGADHGGWRSGEPIGDVRAAKMAVDDGEYRVLDLVISLGDGARTGRLQLVTPFGAAVAAAETPPRDPREAFEHVEAELHAVLYRKTVPLRWLSDLEPGVLLEIPAEALAAVELEDTDGRFVRFARLGKSQGQRALRLVEGSPERPAPTHTVGGIAASHPVPSAAVSEHVAAPTSMADLPAIDGLPPLDVTISD
ncbi:MAG: hypothetical protein AAGK37_07890 [Pseudomonadota bacterium]